MIGLGRRVFGAIRSRFRAAPEDEGTDDGVLAFAVAAAGRPEGAWLTPEEESFLADKAKEGREGILATRYGLICTMVLPHQSTGQPLTGKAEALVLLERKV